MLFLLFVIVLAASIVVKVFANKYLKYNLEAAAEITTAISSFILFVMIIILCCQHIGTDARVEKNLEMYNAIEYKVTSGACRDEFGLLSKEVIDEVQDWNKDVRYYQAIQDNFWVGIFYPNVFDQFKTIDYMNYNTGN